MAPRPYVRLCSPSYVTGRRRRGSTGSPPEWGAQACLTRPRQVSVSDPCTPLTQAGVFLAPRSCRGRSGPHLGGVRVPPRPRLGMLGSDILSRGSGSTDDITVYVTHSEVTWWPRSCPRGGVRRDLPCLLTIVRGTLVPRYWQWPSGSPQGRLQACRWGQSLVGMPFSGTCRRNRRQSIFSHAACHVRPRSWQVRGPRSRRFRRGARGASYCRHLKNIFQRPLGDVRPCVTVRFREDGPSPMYSEAGSPGVCHVDLGPHVGDRVTAST
jgi:hypothetical protein